LVPQTLPPFHTAFPPSLFSLRGLLLPTILFRDFLSRPLSVMCPPSPGLNVGHLYFVSSRCQSVVSPISLHRSAPIVFLRLISWERRLQSSHGSSAPVTLLPRFPTLHFYAFTPGSLFFSPPPSPLTAPLSPWNLVFPCRPPT